MYKEKDSKVTISSLVIFVILSFVLTWTYIVPKALNFHNIISFEMPYIFEIIGAYGPAIAAILVITITSNKSDLLKLFKKIKIWKVDFKWYIVALFLQPAIWISGILINSIFGGSLPDFSKVDTYNYLSNENAVSPLIYIIVFFILQGVSLLGEELGWRGYMLPKLLSVKGWITSSIILGVVWMLWHIPLFFIKDSTQSGISIILYVIDILPTTIIFTWIYVNTKGSVLIATLFHASINTSTVILPILPLIFGSDRPYIIGIILKCLISIVIIILNRNNVKYNRLIDEFYNAIAVK